MKTNKLYIFAFTIAILIVFTTCRKYPEGGLMKQTRLHLFGGHKIGCSKTWKLKLYEVNGIDSTNLINSSNNLEHYNVIFKLIDNKYFGFKASNFYKEYSGSIDPIPKDSVATISPYSKFFALHFDVIYNSHEDSVQCKQINGALFCYRNIFYPEISLSAGNLWFIKKLTKHELILHKDVINSYKIILTY